MINVCSVDTFYDSIILIFMVKHKGFIAVQGDLITGVFQYWVPHVQNNLIASI